MNVNDLKPGVIVRGPILPEPIEVLVVTPLDEVIMLIGASWNGRRIVDCQLLLHFE